MKQLSSALIKRLRLEDAVEKEAEAVRNLLPKEPGWELITSQKKKISLFIANQLRAGFHSSPHVEVSARKPSHGVRPVPYWGVLERIIFRALTDLAFIGTEPVDRSPQKYLEFITAPGRYARDRQRESPQDESVIAFLIFGESPVKYVVKSDITAFYQFVDHSVLAEELLLLGAEFDVIDALIELLAEVQERNYGLPQILEPSDMLSEIYADRIERDLLRAGFAVWRFNDDFRIACDNYEDALAAIEALDAAARRVGLVLSENKTVTVRLSNYIFDAFQLSTSEAGESVNVDSVEDLIGDYTDDFGAQDAADALKVVRRAQVRAGDVEPALDADDWIRLRDLRAEDVRLLRRAVNGLTLAKDPRAIDDVVRLSIYAPSLTPNLMRYLEAVGKGSEPGELQLVAATVDRLVRDVAFNAWQNLWLVDLVRELDLLDKSAHDAEDVDRRADWIENLRRQTDNEALRAVATRALAAHGRVTIPAVIESAHHASSALLHLYTSAAREAAAGLVEGEGAGAGKALTAWARSSNFHGCLLEGL